MLPVAFPAGEEMSIYSFLHVWMTSTFCVNFGRNPSDVLKLLRRVLREARTVAKAERDGG